VFSLLVFVCDRCIYLKVVSCCLLVCWFLYLIHVYEKMVSLWVFHFSFLYQMFIGVFWVVAFHMCFVYVCHCCTRYKKITSWRGLCSYFSSLLHVCMQKSYWVNHLAIYRKPHFACCVHCWFPFKACMYVKAVQSHPLS